VWRKANVSITHDYITYIDELMNNQIVDAKPDARPNLVRKFAAMLSIATLFLLYAGQEVGTVDP